jgi:hypothetical protein
VGGDSRAAPLGLQHGAVPLRAARDVRACVRSCTCGAHASSLQQDARPAPLPENLVASLTGTYKQLNTIHNVVEERKILKHSNSFSGKLANLSIAKKKEKKKAFTRSVSFSTLEREEHTFDKEEHMSDAGCYIDLDCTSEDVRDHHAETEMANESPTKMEKEIEMESQPSPTSSCFDDSAEFVAREPERR